MSKMTDFNFVDKFYYTVYKNGIAYLSYIDSTHNKELIKKINEVIVAKKEELPYYLGNDDKDILNIVRYRLYGENIDCAYRQSFDDELKNCEKLFGNKISNIKPRGLGFIQTFEGFSFSKFRLFLNKHVSFQTTESIINEEAKKFSNGLVYNNNFLEMKLHKKTKIIKN